MIYVCMYISSEDSKSLYFIPCINDTHKALCETYKRDMIRRILYGWKASSEFIISCILQCAMNETRRAKCWVKFFS